MPRLVGLPLITLSGHAFYTQLHAGTGIVENQIDVGASVYFNQFLRTTVGVEMQCTVGRGRSPQDEVTHPWLALNTYGRKGWKMKSMGFIRSPLCEGGFSLYANIG